MATVTARGVCWSTSSNPVVTGSHTTNGTGTGVFTSNITGLAASTTYYVRAYATNSAGTSYGNQVSFTSSAIVVLPTLTTSTVGSITQTTATSGGTITSDGGGTITARGVCWSTSSNPVVTGSHTTNGSGIGVFISNITGLTSSTTYYVRAYATNSAGTSYGNQVSFTTTIVIGDNFQGGIVFYILQPSDPGYISGETHGLIAAPSNQSSGKYWHASDNGVTGATGTAIGTGNANTNAIIALYGTENNAARLCASLVLGGYSDWYLPSKNELEKLYTYKAYVSGLVGGYYWSSTEWNAGYAYEVNFSIGGTASLVKSSSENVRAIRSF